MPKIRFTGRIWKTGNSSVITIPSEHIDEGTVQPGVDYLVSFEEAIEVTSNE